VLPTLIAFGGASNAGLAGTPTGSTAAGPGATGNYFVGGFANATGQVFRRNFPTQRAGVFFQAPLGNNQANADQLIDELQLRQSELGAEKRLNQVEVDVRTGVTALRQARARYEAASKNRTLQEQLAQAEERKFELGASTPQAVLLTLRDLAAARSAEVTALAALNNARVGLDQTLGRTLEASHVVLSEAREGRVARESAAPQQ
jgi:outer membrane protein TolC